MTRRIGWCQMLLLWMTSRPSCALDGRAGVEVGRERAVQVTGFGAPPEGARRGPRQSVGGRLRGNRAGARRPRAARRAAWELSFLRSYWCRKNGDSKGPGERALR